MGALDELNSFLGLCKVKAFEWKTPLFGKDSIFGLLGNIQNDLFSVQAELAGGGKKLKKKRTEEIEKTIDYIGEKISEIKDFVIPGGCELSALLDFARALARRAERKIIATKKESTVAPETFKYINRLSSLLFVLARLANRNYGIKEEEPEYYGD